MTSPADPSNYGDANIYYRYDRVSEEWDSNLGLDGNWTMCGEPEDPGPLVGGEHWGIVSFTYYPFGPGYPAYAFDYYQAQDPVTGDWYLYEGDAYDNDVWALYSDPYASTHYLYYAGNESWRGDTINGVWAVDYYGEGNYYPVEGFSPPEYQGYLVGGDGWSYSTVDDVQYAYDSVLDQWYVDDGYVDYYYYGPDDMWSSWVGEDVWSPTDDPNE
ncbi:MAG TPA: hypothetical protein VHC95_10315 [Opitutales bacterium]|nr:hypothetical protein [Opitutales bacterium]